MLKMDQRSGVCRLLRKSVDNWCFGYSKREGTWSHDLYASLTCWWLKGSRLSWMRTKFDSFWCCYGKGIESFPKLGDSIYFEEEGKELTIYFKVEAASLPLQVVPQGGKEPLDLHTPMCGCARDKLRFILLLGFSFLNLNYGINWPLNCFGLKLGLGYESICMVLCLVVKASFDQ